MFCFPCLVACMVHVGTHGSCVRSNGLLTANSSTAVSGRTNRASLHALASFRLLPFASFCLRMHVGTHGSCVRSNTPLTSNSSTVVSGRTSRASLHALASFRLLPFASFCLRMHVGTHGSCVRSNDLLTANSSTVVSGRTSRASLHFASLFRSFFARKGTQICEQRELREALYLLGLRALRARVREDV